MIDFSKEILVIQEHVQRQFGISDLKLDVTVNSNWHSSVENHRILIRQCIVEKHSQYISNNSVFLDLKTIPKLSENFVSISHSNEVGGFVFSNYPVGFDVVEVRRLNPNIIQRVCLPREIERSPNPNYLWPAKEAVFKACSDFLTTISEIEIGSWEKLLNGFFVFKMNRTPAQQATYNLMNSKQINRGFIFEKAGLLYGIFFR
jgi:phosphopantetheinyl transferase (holo-ACP synthase)